MSHAPTAVTITLDPYSIEFVNAWADELMQEGQWQARHRDEVVSYILNQAVLARASRMSAPNPGAHPPAD
jgi:hypothetical protein